MSNSCLAEPWNALRHTAHNKAGPWSGTQPVFDLTTLSWVAGSEQGLRSRANHACALTTPCWAASATPVPQRRDQTARGKTCILNGEGGANPSKRACLLYTSWSPWGPRDVLAARNQADVYHVGLMLKLCFSFFVLLKNGMVTVGLAAQQPIQSKLARGHKLMARGST